MSALILDFMVSGSLQSNKTDINKLQDSTKSLKVNQTDEDQMLRRFLWGGCDDAAVSSLSEQVKKKAI